jgi:hypothetical protein
MPHMVLRIDILPQTEQRLRQQAEAAGKDMDSYVSQLVEQAAARKSLDEMLAPLRRQFAASGIGDDQLIEDITQAQAEYRVGKHKKTA